MEDLEAAIRNVVEGEFKGAVVEFDDDPGYEKVVGTVVWDKFEGEPQSVRQRTLWDAMRRRLASGELTSIGLMMTLTRAELNSILGEAA